MHRPDNILPSPVSAAPLPEVVNHTPWPAQYFQHVDPHGTGFHVMVCRISYALDDAGDGSEPPLLPPHDQLPLVEADQFMGEPGLSSTLEESDFAPYKPRCDVLLANAVAHAPEGRPLARWAVGFGFGEHLRKALTVTGPRPWLGSSWGTPAADTEVPLSYERAAGGPAMLADRLALEQLIDDATTDLPTRRAAQDYLRGWPEHDPRNPIGCGILQGSDATAVQRARSLLGRAPLEPLAPQLATFDSRPEDPLSAAVPGFGPIGRWWQPRRARAGTHDDHWKATQWPRSPLDHDYRYWNCAPDDQQVPYPQGGEMLTLINLAPGGGTARFTLPRQELRLLVRLRAGPMVFAPMNIDTVIVDLASARLSVVRRALVGAAADVRKLELGTWPADEPVTPGSSSPH